MRSADLWFQCSVWAEMIMHAAPWAPSSITEVIRVALPLHIQPYGELVDRWVFNCRIVDWVSQRRLGSLLYSRSAELSRAQTLFLMPVSNLSLSLGLSQNSHYQPVIAVSTESLTRSLLNDCVHGHLERGKSIRDWLHVLYVDPPRISHVEWYSLTGMCLLGLQIIGSQPLPITCGLEATN